MSYADRHCYVLSGGDAALAVRRFMKVPVTVATAEMLPKPTPMMERFAGTGVILYILTLAFAYAMRVRPLGFSVRNFA